MCSQQALKKVQTADFPKDPLDGATLPDDRPHRRRAHSNLTKSWIIVNAIEMLVVHTSVCRKDLLDLIEATETAYDRRRRRIRGEGLPIYQMGYHGLSETEISDIKEFIRKQTGHSLEHFIKKYPTSHQLELPKSRSCMPIGPYRAELTSEESNLSLVDRAIYILVEKYGEYPLEDRFSEAFDSMLKVIDHFGEEEIKKAFRSSPFHDRLIMCWRVRAKEMKKSSEEKPTINPSNVIQRLLQGSNTGSICEASCFSLRDQSEGVVSDLA